MQYHISKFVDTDYDTTIDKATAELAQEGFGILTEIDVKATLKKKLDHDFRRYIILGACNPPYALRAMTAEPAIGTLLPCNVVVQEYEDGRVEVNAMNPGLMAEIIDNPQLVEVAGLVEAAIRRVLGKL